MSTTAKAHTAQDSPAPQTAPVSPLVNALVESLTQRINAGRYAEANSFPAERELVEEFQVSRPVVRRALDVLERRRLIVRAPRSRTVARPRPQADRSGGAQQDGEEGEPAALRRRTLGFSLWPGLRAPGMSSLVQGIHNVLDHEAYRLIFGHVRWDSFETVLESERQFLEQMTRDSDIAGVLLYSLNGGANLTALQKLRDAGIPVVFLDRLPPESFEADFVGVENEISARQAVDHLIGLGHRSIAHITNLDRASTVAERKAGYHRALRAARIPYRRELIVTATESSFEEAPAVYGALVERLRGLPEDPPTAVFAVNDLVAERFLQAARAAGLRIPEDMSVVGFDGLERWTTHTPFLTTVYQPFERLGEAATRLLLQRIESGGERTQFSPGGGGAGGGAAYRHVLLPSPLHVHGSTAGVPPP